MGHVRGRLESREWGGWGHRYLSDVCCCHEEVPWALVPSVHLLINCTSGCRERSGRQGQGQGALPGSLSATCSSPHHGDMASGVWCPEEDSAEAVLGSWASSELATCHIPMMGAGPVA